VLVAWLGQTPGAVDASDPAVNVEGVRTRVMPTSPSWSDCAEPTASHACGRGITHLRVHGKKGPCSPPACASPIGTCSAGEPLLVVPESRAQTLAANGPGRPQTYQLTWQVPSGCPSDTESAARSRN